MLGLQRKKLKKTTTKFDRFVYTLHIIMEGQTKKLTDFLTTRKKDKDIMEIER